MPRYIDSESPNVSTVRNRGPPVESLPRNTSFLRSTRKRVFDAHVDGHNGAHLHVRSPHLRGRDGGEEVPRDVDVPCLPQRIHRIKEGHRGLDEPPPHPLSSARALMLQPRLAFGPRILVAHFGAHEVPAVEEYFAEVKIQTDKAQASVRGSREGLCVPDKGSEVVGEPSHHRPVREGFASDAGRCYLYCPDEGSKAAQ